MKSIKSFTIIFLSALLFILASFAALHAGQEDKAAPPTSTPGQTLPTISPGELEAFVDGIMAVHMKNNHIAGATFAAVQNGQILLAKGYGYADVAKKIPVAADTTLFRPGSISKLFTWTAVMQLVEQGKIDLNVDVNTYLKDFKIPATFPEPIMMKHLLSHTPGFEEMGIGMFARTPKDLVPMKKFLAENMPARVRPPGLLASYSNYGTALAGYIIETISGIPFEEYIEKNIFAPLGMAHSTFRQPLPPSMAADISVGYKFENGVFSAQDFELINGLAPAGSLSTTAVDIAKFMIAHLQNGRFGETRILGEETAKLMHSRLFAHDPSLDGNAHGFWEWKYNGVDTIGHGGDTIYFHSMLGLIPAQNVGFFVSYNSVGGEGSPRMQLMASLLDRYNPRPEQPEPKPSPDFKARVQKFAGLYLATRVNSSTIEKLGRLMSTLKVKPTASNTLLFSGLGEPRQYVEVSPLVFKEVGGQNTAIFQEDGQGRIVRLFMSQVPIMAFIKLEGLDKPSFHAWLAVMCALLFLSTWLWPVRFIARKICGRRLEERQAPKAARWLAFLMSLSCLVFAIALIILLSEPMQLIFGLPKSAKIFLELPWAAAVLGIGMLVFVIKAWTKKYWCRCARVHYTLVLLALLAFFWLLNYWNLLGLRF
jgi:CubicO group peptidase (beta-lactamase class C family)